MDIEEIRQSVPEYESMLPTPYYFKRLVSFFRRLGKNAKKNGEMQDALTYFNQMFSLSKIWHEVYSRKTSGIEGREVEKAETHLKKLKKTHGTIYAHTFENNGPIAGDVLLSATDYKILASLIKDSSIEKDDTSPKTNVSREKVQSGDARTQKKEMHFQGIPIRWIDGKKLPASGGAKANYQSKSGSPILIEQFVLENYQSVGCLGIWSENEYWWAIMTLLFWDVIFARLPDVYTPEFGEFPSKMQDMPRDFFSAEFFHRRSQLIEKRVSDLTKSRFVGFQRASIEAELKRAYKKHRGKPCRPANWEKYPTVEDLLFATKTLADVQLLDILYRLLEDFNHNRSGMPDLFLSGNDGPMFVEVKSEREKIADKQIEWLKYLKNKVGIDVEICRVVSK